MPSTVDDIIMLLERVAAADRDAFARLYEATSAKLYGVILRILRRPAVAEEVLQDVYVRIWNNAASFDRAKASPITWMAAIARNRALDEARKATPVALDDVPGLHDIRDPALLASERLEQAGEAARLRQCLDGLDAEKRQIVTLAYLDGLSREELATRFGHPTATIKTWLHRSLKQLKACLTS